LNFLYAKKYHGEFILRFDDTDVERSKEEFTQAIEVDLDWLGIVPDAVLRQSRCAIHPASGASPMSRKAISPSSLRRQDRQRSPKADLA
jgi:glutamyl-tRNA synthetase